MTKRRSDSRITGVPRGRSRRSFIFRCGRRTLQEIADVFLGNTATLAAATDFSQIHALLIRKFFGCRIYQAFATVIT